MSKGRANQMVTTGNGLVGMAERLGALGGEVPWRGGDGFTLEVSLPSRSWERV